MIISNFMKFGLQSIREEQTQVMQVLKMTSESVALDELGIGCIRDAFANRMFPGIFTPQKHMKYFSLTPQLYRRATEKRYNRFFWRWRRKLFGWNVSWQRIFVKGNNSSGITRREMIGRVTNSCDNKVSSTKITERLWAGYWFLVPTEAWVSLGKSNKLRDPLWGCLRNY